MHNIVLLAKYNYIKMSSLTAKIKSQGINFTAVECVETSASHRTLKITLRGHFFNFV